MTNNSKRTQVLPIIHKFIIYPPKYAAWANISILSSPMMRKSHHSSRIRYNRNHRCREQSLHPDFRLWCYNTTAAVLGLKRLCNIPSKSHDGNQTVCNAMLNYALDTLQSNSELTFQKHYTHKLNTEPQWLLQALFLRTSSIVFMKLIPAVLIAGPFILVFLQII